MYKRFYHSLHGLITEFQITSNKDYDIIAKRESVCGQLGRDSPPLPTLTPLTALQPALSQDGQWGRTASDWSSAGLRPSGSVSLLQERACFKVPLRVWD